MASFGKFGAGAAKPTTAAGGATVPKFGAAAGATTAPKFGAPGAATAPKFGAPAGATTAPKFGAPAAAAAAPTGAATASATAAPGAATAPKFGAGAATAPKFGAGAATATTTAPKFGANLAAAAPKSSVSITPPAGAAGAAAPGTAAPAATTAPGAVTTAAPGATAPAGTAAPATSTTTGLGGFKKLATAAPTSVGAPAAGTVGAATAAGAAKAPAAWKPNVDVPALLKGKTLEEMINDWSSQIDSDIFQFTQMAMIVGEWDKKVSSNSKKILDLKEKVDLVESAQSELNKNLELITAQQSQLATVLTALEQSVEKWSLTVDLGPQDADRERGYALADDIDVQLNQMSNKLKEMIDRLNASQERESAKDGDHPAFQILQILDSHLNSLSWIDNTSNELAARLGELQSQAAKRTPPSNNYPDTNWGSRYY